VAESAKKIKAARMLKGVIENSIVVSNHPASVLRWSSLPSEIRVTPSNLGATRLFFPFEWV